jgi:hypothetical protein
MGTEASARREAVDAFNALSARENWQQQCDPALRFIHADFPVMLALWQSQTDGRAMPVRADMTPRALKGFLPRVAINERVSSEPPRYTWRLMGTQVAQVLGERTGKFIDEDAPPRQVARWNASLGLVLNTARPMRFLGRVLANDKTYLSSELLFMPLADETGTPRFVLGFGHYAPEISEAPRSAAAPINA